MSVSLWKEWAACHIDTVHIYFDSINDCFVPYFMFEQLIP